MLKIVVVCASVVAVVGVAQRSAADPERSFRSDQSSPAATAPASAEEQFEEQERARFGFDTSLTAVRQAADVSGASQNSLGIPLTPSEKSDLASRVALGQVVGKVEQLANRFEGFGGVWLEQRGPGILHVKFSHQISPIEQRSLEALVQPNDIAIDVTGSTLSNLSTLQQRVTDDMALWSSRGIEVLSVGTDVATGMVDVQISEAAPADAEQTLRNFYDAASLNVFRREMDTQTPGARDIHSGLIYG